MNDIYLFVIMGSCVIIYGLFIYRFRHYLLDRRNNGIILPTTNNVNNPIRDCKIPQ